MRMMFLHELRNAVQHTRKAESIDKRAHQRMLACLLFSSHGQESEWTNIAAHCFAGAKRDGDFVCDWSKERFSRDNKMVRGCRGGWQTTKTWRLLAHEVRGRDSAAQANAGDRFRAI